jgi:hypothetical protein
VSKSRPDKRAGGRKAARSSERLFAELHPDLFEKSYQERIEAEENHPVECLEGRAEVGPREVVVFRREPTCSKIGQFSMLE